MAPPAGAAGGRGPRGQGGGPHGSDGGLPAGARLTPQQRRQRMSPGLLSGAHVCARVCSCVHVCRGTAHARLCTCVQRMSAGLLSGARVCARVCTCVQR